LVYGLFFARFEPPAGGMSPAQLCPACGNPAQRHTGQTSGEPQCAQLFIHAGNPDSPKFARNLSLGPFDSLGIISREILLGISSGIRSFSTLRASPAMRMRSPAASESGGLITTRSEGARPFKLRHDFRDRGLSRSFLARSYCPHRSRDFHSMTAEDQRARGTLKTLGSGGNLKWTSV